MAAKKIIASVAETELLPAQRAFRRKCGAIDQVVRHDGHLLRADAAFPAPMPGSGKRMPWRLEGYKTPARRMVFLIVCFSKGSPTYRFDTLRVLVRMKINTTIPSTTATRAITKYKAEGGLPV
jgi:hypothetical protein